MDAKAISKAHLPSRHVTVGPERAPHRSFLHAVGLSAHEINQPLAPVAFGGALGLWREMGGSPLCRPSAKLSAKLLPNRHNP
jgi:hypothetical protein